MKTLKFRKALSELVLKGEKTATWRLFDDKDLKEGDEIELVIWETGEKFAEGEITKLQEKKLKEIEEKDLDAHEK